MACGRGAHLFCVQSAPIWVIYCFTKLLRPLIKYWRGHGFKVVVYLDDGICSVPADCADAASQFIEDSLAAAGFMAHPVKYHWTPSVHLSWLGFNIDLSCGAR